MDLVDYYETLGCTEEATHEDIKRAYHALALRCHPDKCSSESAHVRFERILEAWKILGNPLARKEYDDERRQSVLELESMPIYARISPNELEVTEEDVDVLVYRCRCGSLYRIQKQFLRKKNSSIHVPCEECTFLVVVET